MISGDLQVEVGLSELVLGQISELVESDGVGVRDGAFVVSLDRLERFQEDSESVPLLILGGVFLIVFKLPSLEEVNLLVVFGLGV